MKVKEEKKERAFKPFKVTLTIESMEEARLLYHVAKHDYLAKEIIMNSKSYTMRGFNGLAKNLVSKELRDIIKKKLSLTNNRI